MSVSRTYALCWLIERKEGGNCKWATAKTLLKSMPQIPKLFYEMKRHMAASLLAPRPHTTTPCRPSFLVWNELKWANAAGNSNSISFCISVGIGISSSCNATSQCYWHLNSKWMESSQADSRGQSTEHRLKHELASTTWSSVPVAIVCLGYLGFQFQLAWRDLHYVTTTVSAIEDSIVRDTRSKHRRLPWYHPVSMWSPSAASPMEDLQAIIERY